MATLLLDGNMLTGAADIFTALSDPVQEAHAGLPKGCRTNSTL